MAAPNEGYEQYPPQEQYGSEAAYADQAAPGSPPPTQPTHEHRKKKRGYASQAYEFGAGGNAAVGGQTTGGLPPMPGTGGGAAPQTYGAYGGYPGQQEYQGAYSGSPAPTGGYGAPGGTPAPGSAGGYQAPDSYYPAGSTAAGTPAGVSGITAGMAGMNMGGQPAAAAQQGGGGGQRLVLNQLYPTDLLTQPFNVSELDLPPPPCILPQNVRTLHGMSE